MRLVGGGGGVIEIENAKNQISMGMGMEAKLF